MLEKVGFIVFLLGVLCFLLEAIVFCIEVAGGTFCSENSLFFLIPAFLITLGIIIVEKS